MASDIANSAVDNGRWHHAAASRALEQQLSPNNVHLNSTHSLKENTGRRSSCSSSIVKSASSVNFSSFTSVCSESDENGLNSSSSLESNDYPSTKPPTPMAQSSGSDSSSDGLEEKDQDEDECEKWAADFIAGTLDSVTTALSVPNVSRRQRSISFAESDSSDDSSNSDDSSELSKSPVGFWFVPPSASKCRSALYEETVWSPEVSPNTSQRNLNCVDDFALNRERKVKFDTKSSIEKNGMHHEVNPNKDHAKNQISPEINNRGIDVAMPLLMKRSLSYSAFSFKRINDGLLSASKATRGSSIDSATSEYEKYYQKFINLLIDRETTPIICNRERRRLTFRL